MILNASSKLRMTIMHTLSVDANACLGLTALASQGAAAHVPDLSSRLHQDRAHHLGNFLVAAGLDVSTYVGEAPSPTWFL